MAIQTFIDWEALSSHRNKLNSNFSELNSLKFDKNWGEVTGEILLEETWFGQVPTRETLISLLGTWLTSKVTVSQVDSTHFSISDWTWLIIDKDTWLYKEVTFSWFSNVLDLYLSNAVTYVLIDWNWALIQQTTLPTPQQLRNNIWVALIWKTSGWIINFTRCSALPVFDWLNVISDLFQATWPLQNWTIRLWWLASLWVSLSAWKIFSLGSNMWASINNPNYADVAISAQKWVRYLYRKTWWTTSDDFLVEAESNVLKPWFYDNWSWTLQSVWTNNFTIQNFWISSTWFIYCQYWQTTYWSLALAKDALQSELRTNWTYTQKLVSLAQIIIKWWATATNNTTDCSIVNLGKFWFIN